MILLVSAPALIDLLVLGGELEPARREALLEDLTDLVRRHLAAALPDAQAWAFAREVGGAQAFRDGRPMAEPHYRLLVSLPPDGCDCTNEEELAGRLARRILQTERPYPTEADHGRVSVRFTIAAPEVAQAQAA